MNETERLIAGRLCAGAVDFSPRDVDVLRTEIDELLDQTPVPER